MPELETAYGFNENNKSVQAPFDREVISCRTCGLVQYRTRTGNCRRCVRLLPPRPLLASPSPKPAVKPETVIRPPRVRNLPRLRRNGNKKWLNLEMVENIGRRIQQFRESRGLTQSELQELSGVSRSYLSRIEIGQMTPSLGTVEKISEALGIGLNRFFSCAANCDAVLEDPFIQKLQPLLRDLDYTQRATLLKRLAAIGNQAWTGVVQLPDLLQPKGVQIDAAVTSAIESREMPSGRGNGAARSSMF